MLNPELLGISYGLASAVAWGTGDFSGGFVTKRTNVYTVFLASQAIGGGLLVLLAFVLSETMPPFRIMLLGGAAGIFGAIGLTALYQGLASGRMGVVAPVSAVVTAALPVLVGLFIEGVPPTLQLAGFGMAFLAVWLLSSGNGETRVQAHELGLPVVAGIGFGVSFILINQVSDTAILWPLVSARVAAIALTCVVIILFGQGEIPQRRHLPVIALTGICSCGGTAFFALATQVGRLDISAVLGSLYPATTVLLAWLILREQLSGRQWIGVITALGALVLIAS